MKSQCNEFNTTHHRIIHTGADEQKGVVPVPLVVPNDCYPVQSCACADVMSVVLRVVGTPA